jgi:hypothetical protein
MATSRRLFVYISDILQHRTPTATPNFFQRVLLQRQLMEACQILHHVQSFHEANLSLPQEDDAKLLIARTSGHHRITPGPTDQG